MYSALVLHLIIIGRRAETFSEALDHVFYLRYEWVDEDSGAIIVQVDGTIVEEYLKELIVGLVAAGCIENSP